MLKTVSLENASPENSNKIAFHYITTHETSVSMPTLTAKPLDARSVNGYCIVIAVYNTANTPLRASLRRAAGTL